MANWLAETFSAEASEEDIIKSRALNSTRIAAVVFPVLSGIATAIAELADKEPFNEPGFQKVLIIAALAFIAVVVVADLLARAISTTRLVPVATTLPGIAATWVRSSPPIDLTGTVIAFRAANASVASDAGEFFFVPDEASDGAAWIPASALKFRK